MMTGQHRKRVKAILESLSTLRYSQMRPAGSVSMVEGTYELKPKFRKEGYVWQPFEPGGTWGGRGKHYRFYGPVEIPVNYENQLVVLMLNVGTVDTWNTDNPQVLVYLNGKLAFTMDMSHTRMILVECGKAGTVLEIAFYAYPNSAGKTNFFDVTIGTLNRNVGGLYYNVKALWGVADLLKEDDLKRLYLSELLNNYASCLDLRRTDNIKFFRSVAAVRRLLAENYYDVEHGISPVTVHGVGHTHIDVAWKWPLWQTGQKAVGSLLTVLGPTKEYPKCRFMFSQLQLYEFVKKKAPELYEQIKERVREGRWETEGAMQLKADCNLISGESMTRQILYGKQFFKQKLGTGDDEVMWLPNVFGYSVAMPQILKKPGVKYFMTTKIG